MDFVELKVAQGLATVTLNRGKVNALNEPSVEQLRDVFNRLEKDPVIDAVVLTGQGKFFSFGFDIPEFLSYNREAFRRFLTKFSRLYTNLFLFPKPLIAGINGHAIAGGCMLTTCCDRRLMVSGKAKISLNEIGFGSSVFAGSVEMLKFWVGSKHASEMLHHGKMYSADEAARIGLVDHITTLDGLAAETASVAQDYAQKDIRAYAAIKALLRRPVVDVMQKWEQPSIEEFLDLWYSPETWQQLQDIKIYS